MRKDGICLKSLNRVQIYMKFISEVKNQGGANTIKPNHLSDEI